MLDVLSRACPRAWVAPVLALLLILGHACELPLLVDLIGTAHAEAAHHADAAAAEPGLTCDVVDVTSAPVAPQLGPSLEISVPLASPRVPVARMDQRAPDGPARLATGPPLFLLHASLLI